MKFINGSREAVYDIHNFLRASVGILVPRFACTRVGEAHDNLV